MAARRSCWPPRHPSRRSSVLAIVFGALLAALLGAPIATARLGAKKAHGPEVSLDASAAPYFNATAATQLALNESPGDQMPLLDCAFATGSPNGLMCDKEGTFVVGWEKRGQWIAGGGSVPLSRALCCRLGVPDNVTSESMPEVPLTPAKPVAAVSFGCHPSTINGPMQVMCENQDGVESLLTGYSTAVGVGLRLDTYYPLGAAQCCTPALLLDNGDLWSYRRCNCRTFPNEINCPYDQGFASMGFAAWRMTRGGSVVPIAPAECCQVCLGDRLKKTDQCTELDNCNGRGHCSFGQCECFRGWEGPDCARRGSDSSSGILDSWQLAVVIIGATGMLASLLILCSHLYRLQQREDMEGREDEYDIPLLLDEVGSVGSVDTSDEEDEDEDGECDQCPEEEEGEGQEDGAAAGEGSREEDGHARGSNGEAEASEGRGGGPVRGRRPRNEGSVADRAAGAGRGGVEPLEAHHVEVEGGSPQQGGGGESREVQEEDSEDDDGPLALNPGAFAMADSGECLVCMLKPIQAVLIPCGHAISCRRCSRRLTRCPMCRKDILRRQRLYLGK